MLRLITKTLFASSIFSSAFFVDFSKIESNVKIQNKKNSTVEENQSPPENVEDFKSIEDIELFEKQNNCYFAFVGSWGKSVYKVREFLKEYKDKGNSWDTEGESRALEAAKKFKKQCKDNGSEALFWNGRGFWVDPNAFKKK